MATLHESQCARVLVFVNGPPGIGMAGVKDFKDLELIYSVSLQMRYGDHNAIRVVKAGGEGTPSVKFSTTNPGSLTARILFEILLQEAQNTDFVQALANRAWKSVRIIFGDPRHCRVTYSLYPKAGPGR